ncbi:hypothetical protein FKP32DRAFT_1582448 [Trametes sanguinea]|nr:hypothetical protein FKP32DRAFT_1582448 [Trametes sanguinea]
MVNWRSSEELMYDSEVFQGLVHTIAGIYIWEFTTSLDFEWGFLIRRKRFRYPAFFYFLNRYCLLFTMLGLLIALNTTTDINCQALYTFNQITGQASSGLASINLSIRTMALWSHKRSIVILIVGIILGHWSLIFHGALLRASWVPEAGCQVTGSNNTILAATFIYSMSFDFVIMVLSMYKLAVGMNGHRSPLAAILFQDGLVYFIVAFMANLLATVFIMLDLNPILSVMFNVPAAVVSTVVACRAVRRLSNFSFENPQVFSSTNQNLRVTRGAVNDGVTAFSPRVTLKSNASDGADIVVGV